MASVVLTGDRAFVTGYLVVGIGLLAYAVVERSPVLAGVAVATPLAATGVSLVESADWPAYPAAIGMLWYLAGAIVGVSRA